MKEQEFSEWLEAGGAQTKAGRQSRKSAVKAIERKLVELGSSCSDLDAAWEFDRFEHLRERLRGMRQNARDGGQDYRILMPVSESPLNRLSNWNTWLASYGRFLDGESPRSSKDADCIRQYVLERYIEPARDEGLEMIDVLVRDVHQALDLNQAWANICQALTGRKMQELAQVPAPERIGAEQSPATVFRFRVDGHPVNSTIVSDVPGDSTMARPTNLILYGPPGTGKTFATAAEAVRLCGEIVPEDRDSLMASYQRLCDAKRIEFVTFHQSMSYEDFVEGKQPVTDTDGDGNASTGFRLETIPGIFRRIARRAETSRGQSAGPNAIAIEGRQVFKTSIGEAANPEDAYLFEEAITGGYTLLGFEDIDWSDERYAGREAMIEACRKLGNWQGELNAQSGRVQMPFIFRNWVNPGDIVVATKGNGLFRAIGEVTGGYEFHPRPEGGYAHRRAVRWLWVDRDGVPVSEIYRRKFSMRTIYLLEKEELNVPALERYMNSQQPQAAIDPDQFVLIIDEINRANISKVFGELITLLEPDKRLGQPNQLKVRLPYSPDEFGVPANLHIVGTMNTADRSIALLDTALRRRFEFRELMPDPAALKNAARRTGIDLAQLLATINERIEYLFDREHQIGHAYFMNCETRGDVDAVMRHKIIPLLAEYFYEDWSKIAAVVGDAEAHEGSIRGGFLNRTVLKPPPGLDNAVESAGRFRWSLRSHEDGFDYTRLVSA
ncbi:AAA family ATPase [Kaistia granuli]|uniref:AAA family ATPase n=1 Tax=Kaistia granuli TaxID=363259 RepID=UPI0006860899|nr:AAA family ATPase [Kaistia granuli]